MTTTALSELQAALQEARTEAATLRIEVDVYRDAARAAVAYLAAHSALTAAGVSPERPDAARHLGDAWVALTKACANVPAGGPEQDRGDAALRPAALLDHAFKPAPYYPDRCDVKLSGSGTSRYQCARPPQEHQS